jgi:hypothetical protein
MNNLQEKAREILALSKSYGLTPQLEKVEDDRINIKHANQFWTVVSLTPKGRVSVSSLEKASGRFTDIATKNLPVYLEKYARREKKEGAK